jgi:hypothetical protein
VYSTVSYVLLVLSTPSSTPLSGVSPSPLSIPSNIIYPSDVHPPLTLTPIPSCLPHPRVFMPSSMPPILVCLRRRLYPRVLCVSSTLPGCLLRTLVSTPPSTPPSTWCPVYCMPPPASSTPPVLFNPPLPPAPAVIVSPPRRQCLHLLK